MCAERSFDLASGSELRAVVGEPTRQVMDKESSDLDERARAFIAASPFCLLATGDASGNLDVSPKGGPPGFVKALGSERLLVPEFPGNRRLDGAHNLATQPGVALLFVVPGISETLRVNGQARVTRDPELAGLCAVDDRPPWFLVDVEVRQVFHHCGKAFLRSRLWEPESWPEREAVVSPSRTIRERAAKRGVSEAQARRELEESYRPGLY